MSPSGSTQERKRAASEKRIAIRAAMLVSGSDAAKLTILTIGHSTRTFDEFLVILKAHQVERLVDVRAVPKSRRMPHFNTENLGAELHKHGIEYIHLKSLGGRRQPRKDSVNTGWRNVSFRGYADYMATQEFQAGLERLLELARTKRSAIMCAEAVPWRCHRSLIGDALLARDVDVKDIMSATNLQAHKLTPFAQVKSGQIVYPGEQLEFPKT